MRIGLGIDLHRLAAGRRCVLGGVALESPIGPEGHSDADVVVHAVCDALLGASGQGDLGMLYPDTDPANRGKDSMLMLRDVVGRVHAAAWRVHNVDIVVECESIKIAPARDRIVASLAAALRVEPGRVNVRGKTGEKLDAVGRGEAIRATAVALLRRGSSLELL